MIETLRLAPDLCYYLRVALVCVVLFCLSNIRGLMPLDRLRHFAYIAVVAVLGTLLCGCAYDVERTGRPCPDTAAESPFDIPPVAKPRLKFTPSQEATPAKRLEFALECALDYGLTCALNDTLQWPVEKVQRNPLRCGLRAGFEDALEWGLRQVLEDEHRNSPQEVFQNARQQALESARKDHFAEVIDSALGSISIDDSAKASLREKLAQTLDAFLDESFDFALDNALHVEPETIVGDGAFIWPIDDPAAYVTSTFGYRGKTRRGRRHFHAGIDIVVPKHTPVMAVANGIVTFAGESGSGYGRIVKIDHGDGLETWYAHLDSYSVHEGDGVPAGVEIGRVGCTGRATTNHLHFEVHENGEPVDPQPYLQ